MNYYITFDSSGGISLAHGVEWRRHKYIRKEGKRYIYPEDLKRSVGKAANSMQAKAAAVQANARGMNKTAYYKSEGWDYATAKVVGRNGELSNWHVQYTKPRKELEYAQDKDAYLAKEKAAKEQAKKDAAKEAVYAAQHRGAVRTGEIKDRQTAEAQAKKGDYSLSRHINNHQLQLNERAKQHAYEYHLSDAYASQHPVKAFVNRGKDTAKKVGTSALETGAKVISKGYDLVSKLLKKKK